MTGVATMLSVTRRSRRFGLDRVAQSLRDGFAKVALHERGDARRDRTVAVGSVVRVFDVDSLREETIVVAPGQVAADASMGVALIGAREGETREWESPSGPRRLRIAAIVGRVPEGTSATAAPLLLPRAAALGTPRAAKRKEAA